MITLLTLVVMAAPQGTVEVQMTHEVRLVQQVEVSVNLPPNLADQVCINRGIPPLRDNLTVYSKLGAEALMAYPRVARRLMSQDSSRVIGCIVEAEVTLYKKASRKKSRKKRNKRRNRKK